MINKDMLATELLKSFTGKLTSREYNIYTVVNLVCTAKTKKEFDFARKIAKSCPDYLNNSILQYIGNWSGDDPDELIESLYEDILSDLLMEKIRASENS